MFSFVETLGISASAACRATLLNATALFVPEEEYTSLIPAFIATCATCLTICASAYGFADPLALARLRLVNPPLRPWRSRVAWQRSGPPPHPQHFEQRGQYPTISGGMPMDFKCLPQSLACHFTPHPGMRHFLPVSTRVRGAAHLWQTPSLHGSHSSAVDTAADLAAFITVPIDSSFITVEGDD